MNGKRKSGVGAVVAMVAVALAVTTAIAQPSETTFPKTCNANQCIDSGSTLVMCALSTDQGCCCKFSGQTSFTCQCVDELTCLTSTNCFANITR